MSAVGRDAQTYHSAADYVLVGECAQIAEVRRLIRRASEVDSTVLILGESGTGKEIVARLIHNLSTRFKQPFVPINCGAVPQELLASELFGHERGAFTGAVVRRKGRFEMAGQGTLLLDEIGEMSTEMQVKLLRVLQERRFERLGSQSETLLVKARVIAATHRDLEMLVGDGGFRQDLYYRLNVFPIRLPPLRERGPEDVALLVRHALRCCIDRGLTPPRLSAPIYEMLCRYHWPGNVRQVNNIVERLCVMYPEADLTPDQLPDEIRNGSESCHDCSEERPVFEYSGFSFPADFDLKSHLESIEKELINQAIQQASGVIAKAARLLGVRRTTLVEKLKRYGCSE